MQIIPLKDYILIEEKVEEATNAGIILPESADMESTQMATIVAVGENSKLSVGDKVMFKHYGFDEIVVEKKKYRIGKEENIFAVLKP